MLQNKHVLTLDTYLPERRHQGTFTTDSGLLAYGEHSAYLQLMEIERLLALYSCVHGV